MSNDYQFQVENKDPVKEKLEILAMKMDIHKSGILFLNEVV